MYIELTETLFYQKNCIINKPIQMVQLFLV